MILGPIVIILFWILALIIYIPADKNAHTTVSGLAISSKKNHLLFSVGFFLSGVALFIFFKIWFVKALDLPSIFIYLAAVATLLLQPIAAFAPFKGEKSFDLHNVSIYAEGALLPIMSAIVASSSVLPAVIRILCWALTIFMIYLIIEFKRQFLKPKFKSVQIAYTASLHLTILIATFTKLLK